MAALVFILLPAGATSGGVLVQELSVPNTEPRRVTSEALEDGRPYVIEASGTFDDWGNDPHGIDAVWCFAEWRVGPSPAAWQQLRIVDGDAEKGMIDLAGGALPYDPRHVYRVTITGRGRPLVFFLTDAVGSAADNKGAVTVRIFRADGASADAAPTSDPAAGRLYVPNTRPAGSGNAREVHWDATAGTWSTDPATGMTTGAIPNDCGGSFWLLPRTVDRSSFTVSARVRFRSHVDYGGVGIAVLDPNSTHERMPHLRLELSERQDHFGAGGWLDRKNDYYATAESRHTDRDIRVGEWYRLTLEVRGTRVRGWLDDAELFDADVPAVASLPATLQAAFFITEADAEFADIRADGTSGASSGGFPDPRPYVENTTGAPGDGRGADAVEPPTARPADQRSLEAEFTRRAELVRIGRMTRAEMVGDIADWILALGDRRLLLNPLSGRWHYYDRLHDTWEETDFAPGAVEFVIEAGRLVARPQVGAR